MNRMTGKIRLAIAAVFASAALTVWGITITLTGDAGGSVSCTSNQVNVSDGAVSATVPTACIPTGGGGGGGTGPWTLTVARGGAGTGTVTGEPPGNNADDIDCGANCAAEFDNNVPVVLTATAGANSAFGSWIGCTSSNGATCNVTMNAAKAVTATFNPTGGGGGGGGSDPGAGTNPWINGSNYVHNRGALTELYVPRCVPSQYNNCRNGGQLSLYDTVVAGQVWAMRIPAGSGFASQPYLFGVERAESGETLNAYDFAVSSTPGDFNVINNCKLSGTGQVRVHNPAVYTPPFGVKSCPINPNTMYYLNVRPQAGSPGATQCGIGAANACRYRITLPGGFPYQAGQ